MISQPKKMLVHHLCAVLLMLTFAAAQETECGDEMCFMECGELGFKLDENGCEICECNQLELYEEKCEGVECDEGEVCHVIKLTRSGHFVPHCIDPERPIRCESPIDMGPCNDHRNRWFYNRDTEQCEVFVFGGCEGNQNNFESEEDCNQACSPEMSQCDNKMCMMYCPAGRKVDERGCELCECLPEPCKDNVHCGLSCRHGHKKDAQGCKLCECLQKPPCLKIECMLECEYGRVTMDDGCELCECQKEPCAGVQCGKEEHCQQRKVGGEWETKCVSLHVSKPWCGPPDRPMCAMHCEHSFISDQYNCSKCECRTGPPVCTTQECTEQCDYGIAYDENGCHTCECLPTPCKMDSCPVEKACEVRPIENCPSCPSVAACIEQEEVKRVSVSLQYYSEDEVENLNSEELLKEFEEQLSELIGIAQHYLRGLKVEKPEELTYDVSFHMVNYGDGNLVEMYEVFKQKVTEHTEHSMLVYGETKLIPEHATLQSQYYSDMEVPEEDDVDVETEEEDMTQMIIIIAVVAAGCVGLITVIVILFAVVRSKTKHKGQRKPQPKTNVIYKKAPADEKPKV